MPFEEVPHSADCAIRAWAPDLVSLLAEAARGLNAVSGVRLRTGPRVRRDVAIQASDDEGLLVSFLSELVYAQEQEHLGFDDFALQAGQGRLSGTMYGAPLEAIAKPIKAVTYHNLEIRRTSAGREAEIVFDV